MTRLISITLISKNNKKTGKYLYIGVAKIGNAFYRVSFPVYDSPKKINDIEDDLILGTVIFPKHYKANGIEVKNGISRQEALTIVVEKGNNIIDYTCQDAFYGKFSVAYTI